MSPYGERVRSQHLYQLITYLQHGRARNESKGLSGMLIYPAVGQSLRLRLLDIPTLVVTIDIGREWQDIEIEIHGLVDECASAAGYELSSKESVISMQDFVSGPRGFDR
jgi:5-methylcytosine-specific restriction enzyme subunit McrC